LIQIKDLFKQNKSNKSAVVVIVGMCSLTRFIRLKKREHCYHSWGPGT